jgi:hypothetical protein
MEETKTARQLAEDHKYQLPSGDIAINVTAISGLIDDGKAIGFGLAARKFARQGLDHEVEWNKKAELGTRVHGYIEAFMRGEDVEVQEGDEAHADAVEAFLTEKQPILLEQEQICLSDHGYGGRFDMIVQMDGDVWLLDLKTGKAHAVEHTLQLSAYRFSDGIAVYSEEGDLTGLRPLPPIVKAGGLYTRTDGSYHVVEYPADETSFQYFLDLLRIYKWLRSDQVKALKKVGRQVDKNV